MNIKEYLNKHILIMDGAMGTYFETLMGTSREIAEKANETHPKIIQQIHAQYIEAGAKLIRTNTFATNSICLSIQEEKKQKVTDNIKMACEIAKKAVSQSEKEIYIGADIGPIPELPDQTEDVMQEYFWIIDAFLQCEMNCFVLETFPDTKQVEILAKYIKEKKKDAFILAQFAVGPSGYSSKGFRFNKILEEAAHLKDVDAIGFNCAMSALHMLNFLKKESLPVDKYISALPNCGYPLETRAKNMYVDGISYFAEKMGEILSLGVNIIGGCCGTTPNHIKKLSKLYALECPKEKQSIQSQETKQKTVSYSPFYSKMQRGEKTIVVELDPPFQADSKKIMDGAHYLKQYDVDLITVADSPMARPRADAFLLASKIQRETGIMTMPHLSCRDKNAIGMRATFLGGHIENLRHALIVTGDPVSREDRDSIKSVFNYNSIKLMDYLKQMNQEFFENEPYFYGGALNQNSSQVDKVIERMEKKIEAGAGFFLTQPVYSEENIEKLAYIKQKTDTKILFGIMPLVSFRNARFIQNEMFGIDVPDSIVERYKEDMSREEAQEIAVDISVEIIEKCRDIADGFYFMTPFNRVELIGEIIRKAKL